jgi:arginine N-succinyltransferase
MNKNTTHDKDNAALIDRKDQSIIPMRFRPARACDAEPIFGLTQKADAGMTTIPRSLAEVHEAIDQTERFLNGDKDAHKVLFVAYQSDRLLGISALIPRLGWDRPFYSFKKVQFSRQSAHPPLRVTYTTLQLSSDFDGCTELATLFLAPEARGTGASRLLSLGRLAFIHNHRGRFSNRLMADIRGWSEPGKEPPFWTHLASKFIDLDFDTADRLSAQHGIFIDQLLPTVPLFLNLLPDEAASVVGKPNDQSAPALALLRSVGFEMTDLCDVFDAGPSMACHTDQTLVARTSVRMKPIDALSQPETMLIFSGDRHEFCAGLAPGHWAEGLCLSHAIDDLGMNDQKPIYGSRLKDQSHLVNRLD